MALSPMMQQYLRIKEQYPDCLIFFRLGDFYEMFFDDAQTASRELDLTLTGRDCGMPERAPMCGVPYHAVDSYLARLIEKGYKVAICEQLTDPSASRGIVERDVIRVVTPGTVIDGVMLPEDKNVYLVSVCYDGKEVGVSWLDISTGEFNHACIDTQIRIRLNELLSRINPAEIICNEEMLTLSGELSLVKFNALCPFKPYREQAFETERAETLVKEQLSAESFAVIKDKPVCVRAAGALLDYVISTQKRKLKHIHDTSAENGARHMTIDPIARRTLELTASVSDGKKYGSLLWVMDKTSTSMGARLLRKWLEQPSMDGAEINARLDAVAELTADAPLADALLALLDNVYDIERLAGRLSYGNMTPPDCLALARSLKAVPGIRDRLNGCSSVLLHELCERLDTFEYETDLITRAVREKAPAVIRDGNIINTGYDEKLDDYRATNENAAKIIEQLEEYEKKETGIKNLKIRSNKVFGYYIEVSNSQLDLVPYRYIRKQTIAGGERYITQELKELEEKIVNANFLSVARENELYADLLQKLSGRLLQYLSTAKALAYLDCILSHAIIARENGYVRPVINESIRHIKISEGRHPVVEKLLKGENFVPNDTLLDDGDNKIMLITGPNMAGKSIYMRQVALITLMAHTGSFVPANKAEIALTDKIFTRVGASDDIATARSTFMVEMSEVSFIMENATDRSLILLDEIGRGTSTYDGLSIAWSIIEFLSGRFAAKVLFSTHYHELTDLEGTLPGVKNYKLTVREIGDAIVFLRKLMRGSANRSFGIEVAGLAGLPPEIIRRAKELLAKLEASDIGRQAKMSSGQQLSIFNAPRSGEVLRILNDLDLDSITPRAAFDILSDLKEKVKLDG